MERRPELIDYLGVLYRWRRFLVLGTLLISTLAVGATFLLPKYYTTTATVLVSKSKVAGEGMEPYRTYTVIKSFLSFIENNSLHLDILERFHLRKPPYQLNMKQFQRLVAVRHVWETDLIELEVSFPDADLAQQIATALIEEAVRRNRELNQAEALESQAFIGTELERARQTREQLHQELLEYRKTRDSNAYEHRLESINTLLPQFDIPRHKLDADVFGNEARLLEARQQFSAFVLPASRALAQPFSVGTMLGLVSDTWLASVAKLRLAELASHLAGIRAEQRRLDDLMVEFDARIEQWNREFGTRAQTIQDLEDRYKTANKVYEQMAVRYNEATVIVGSRSQDLRIVDAPFRPEKPSWPNRLLTAVLAPQVAFLMLTCAAFLLDYIAGRRGRL